MIGTNDYQALIDEIRDVVKPNQGETLLDAVMRLKRDAQAVRAQNNAVMKAISDERERFRKALVLIDMDAPEAEPDVRDYADDEIEQFVTAHARWTVAQIARRALKGAAHGNS